MTKLEQLIKELESKIPQRETIVESVSSVSVGWQIEHILLVINQVSKALQHPRVAYKWKFNYKRILFLNKIIKIPRGKLKAPKHVQPEAAFDLENIKKLFETARENIKALETIDGNLFFEHPFLGHLKVKQTKKFLYIHSKHHLEIIEDIINKI